MFLKNYILVFGKHAENVVRKAFVYNIEKHYEGEVFEDAEETTELVILENIFQFCLPNTP